MENRQSENERALNGSVECRDTEYIEINQTKS